ncbi:type IV pilus biogenesis/stability protein PilW [Methylophaga sp. 41_12_T18]|nr:type IV pilus biogenesis/stability protein PilW [Methylophaga sp. 41_12_T18]
MAGNAKNICIALVLLMVSACTTPGGSRPIEQVAPDPKAAEINMRLGLNYLQRGNYEIALEKLQKSLRQNPNLPSAHNTIALLYQQLKESDKAEKHFKEAVRRAPDYSEAQNNYGVFLCQQQRYEESEQYFLAAIKNPLYRRKAQALENTGVCAMRIPDYERAETYFRQSLQLNPKMSTSLIKMAEISHQQQDFLQARAYIQRYRDIAAWTAKSLLLAIKTENQLNDQDAVASYALLLRARFPDSDESLQVKKGLY